MQEITKNIIEFELSLIGQSVFHKLMQNLYLIHPSCGFFDGNSMLGAFTQEGVDGITDPDEDRSQYQTFEILKYGIFVDFPALPKDCLKDLKPDDTVNDLLITVFRNLPSRDVLDVRKVEELKSGKELC